MKSKIILILLLPVLVIAGVIAAKVIQAPSGGTDNSSVAGSFSDQTDNAQSLTLEIISTDNYITNYYATFSKGQNLLTVLSELANGNADFTYATDNYGFAELLTTINEEKADALKNEFWNIKINGKDSAVGVTDIFPEANDEIKFSLINY
jgi:DNA-directed RNA polymerase subunit F